MNHRRLSLRESTEITMVVGRYFRGAKGDDPRLAIEMTQGMQQLRGMIESGK